MSRFTRCGSLPRFHLIAICSSVGRQGSAFRVNALTSAESRRPRTGLTIVTSDEPIPVTPGLTVRITFGPMFGFDAGCHAREAIRISRFGKTYSGPSSPWWYSARDLYRLMQQVMPPETTVARLCRDLGFDIHDNRIARQLRRCDAEALLQRLRENNPPVPPERLGMLGPSASGERHYAIKSSTTGLHDGAKIPYVTEAWAECTRSENRGHGTARLQLLLNRTPSLAAVVVNSRSKELILQGCNLYRLVQGPGTGHYNITLSIIAPYIQLANDGKEPCLAPFSEAIAEVLRKACSAAHRAMEKPARKCTIKDAAWQVMAKAYSAASGDGRYPANARQIMYAARPDILKLTGATKLDDRYFTQTLLPDYIEAHPSETRDWDVVFDARGNFIEPHTSREVPLGTIEVRQYLGDRPYFERSIALNSSTLSPTSGPEHRYSAVLLIEKEGFGPLLQRARTAERFDLAIMSTKGMSTVAARMLADRLAARIDKVLVLHDLDVSGFSIFGTLAADGRRYRFKHNVRIVDLGLRLADVEARGLQSEPVENSGSWFARAATLDTFVSFLERKLPEHGIGKVVPDDATLHRHARHVVEQTFAEKALDEVRAKLRTEAASAFLPNDLGDRVRTVLRQHPEMPWDLAVAAIVREARS